MRHLPVSFLLLLAVACDSGAGTDETGDTAGGHDTSDTGDVDLGPPGCINLNGTEGDFATIGEALPWAKPGDTVNVCAGEYSETVVLVPGVQVVGESSANTSLDAPVNAAAFEVPAGADGAGIAGFTITSTRSGVTIDSAANVTLTDIVFDNVANYGVEANAATGLTIVASTFTMPAYGGVFLSGGSATVDSSVFTEPTSYGIWATGEAALTATNNIFNSVHATTTDGSDGHAIFGDASSVTMSGNVINLNDLIGIWVADGSLTMSGDTINDTPYSILAFDSAFTADGIGIYGAQAQGIYATHKSEPLTITNSTVALNGGVSTGLTSCSEDYDTERSGFCGGILLAGNTITISDTTVSDYEEYGTYLVPYARNDNPIVTLTNLTLDNNGRWSLLVSGATSTIDGLVVTNHREPDTTNTEPCYGYIDQGTAAVFEQGDATITNSTVAESEGWGFSFVQATVTLTNSTISGNQCSGVINFSGSLNASGNTFTLVKDYGGLFNYQAALVLDGNTFVDTAYTRVDEYDDGTGTGAFYRYIQTGGGQDINLYDSTACLIANNTFTGGDNGIYANAGACEITGNTWSDYGGQVLYAYQGDKSDPVNFHDNTVDDVAGPVVNTTYGYVEASDLTIGSTRAYTYSYESWYVDADGVESLNYSYSSTYGQPVFEAQGYYYGYWNDSDADGTYDTYTEYAYEAGIKLENVSVANAYSSLLQVNDASLEARDLTAESVGGYGIYGYWSHYAPQIEIDGVDLGSTAYQTLYLSGNTADAGYALIEDVNVDVAGSSAIQISGISEVSLVGASVLDTTGYGLMVSGSYGYTDYSVPPYGSYVSGTLAYSGTFSEIEVESATYDGIVLSDGVVALDLSTATGGDSSGLALSNTTATVSGNVFQSNAAYGMTCSNVTFSACSGNTLDGNGSGAHLDCSDDCSL